MSRFMASVSLVIGLAQCTVPSFPGFNLTWSDEFIGAGYSLPSTQNWQFATGTSYPGGAANWGTKEIQSYGTSPENVRLTGEGIMRITAIKDANNAWTSARMETVRTDFMAKEGGKMRIQARISLPSIYGEGDALGYWPAFWTLGGSFRGNYQNWPSIGEIDIMENANGNNKVAAVIHCGTLPGGICQEPMGLASHSECANGGCQGTYHDYAVEVNRSGEAANHKITWFVDGQASQTITRAKFGDEVWNAIVNQGHFLLLNVAIGGAMPDAVAGVKTPTAATVPGKYMEVDYVAVYNTL